MKNLKAGRSDLTKVSYQVELIVAVGDVVLSAMVCVGGGVGVVGVGCVVGVVVGCVVGVSGGGRVLLVFAATLVAGVDVDTAVAAVDVDTAVAVGGSCNRFGGCSCGHSNNSSTTTINTTNNNHNNNNNKRKNNSNSNNSS